jgi:hypothetical protein
LIHIADHNLIPQTKKKKNNRPQWTGALERIQLIHFVDGAAFSLYGRGGWDASIPLERTGYDRSLNLDFGQRSGGAAAYAEPYAGGHDAARHAGATAAYAGGAAAIGGGGQTHAGATAAAAVGEVGGSQGAGGSESTGSGSGTAPGGSASSCTEGGSGGTACTHQHHGTSDSATSENSHNMRTSTSPPFKDNSHMRTSSSPSLTSSSSSSVSLSGSLLDIFYGPDVLPGEEEGDVFLLKTSADAEGVALNRGGSAGANGGTNNAKASPSPVCETAKSDALTAESDALITATSNTPVNGQSDQTAPSPLRSNRIHHSDQWSMTLQTLVLQERQQSVAKKQACGILPNVASAFQGTGWVAAQEEGKYV